MSDRLIYVFAVLFSAVVGGFVISFASRIADMMPVEWLGVLLLVILTVSGFFIWRENRLHPDP